MSWENLDSAMLEQQYSPSSCVDDLGALLSTYVSESKKSEARTTVIKDLMYGDHPDESLDYFPASNKKAPIHVFIHGGYWQELSKNESTFPGADFVDSGIAYAAINYTLAPRAGIGQIVEQCRRSIRWLYKNAGQLGFNRDKLFISGSSAGAHLACMALLTPWETYGLPGDLIKGATLMSGIYDLRPICHTYINEPLRMDEEEAVRLSPLFMTRSGKPPVIICWGEFETDEFKRQSRVLSEAWLKEGNEAVTFEVSGHNHFDIVHTLARAETQLGYQVKLQMTGGL